MSRTTKRDGEIPSWVLWMFEHGFAAFMVATLTALIAVVASAYWIERRLGGLEERFSQRRPPSYVAPDLSAFAPTDFDESAVTRTATVYVPTYSHAYSDGGRPTLLETTLSVRNVSPSAAVFLRSVRYYDTRGALVKAPLDQTIELKPLQTIEFLVPQRDTSGGSGANFLVEWLVTDEAQAPLVEALMIGSAGPRGVCLRTRGVVVDDGDG